MLTFTVVTLSACTFTTGEGPVVEREFAVESFTGVELDGSFDVSINQSATQQVVAVGHENILDKLKLNVVDGILYIKLEQGSYINYELEVKISISDLEQARLLGSGDIRIGTFANLDNLKVKLDGSGDIETIEESVIETTGETSVILDGSGDIDLRVKAHELSAELEGSGDIDLEGFTEELNVVLDGSGDIKAYDLESMNCEATLDGSGSIRVYATKVLKATLDGSGDITYKGEPKVEASIDGSGSISAK
jgi:hypothetical protein